MAGHGSATGRLEVGPQPWSLPPQALAEALRSSVSVGLSRSEARRRLRAHGPNALRTVAEPSRWRLLARQFGSPLVLILLIGAAISAVLGEWAEAAIIVVIVGSTAGLGFWQEARASTALGRLRRRLALHARVRRDARELSVPATQLVPGDLLLLSAGNLVPADAVVIEARDFLVVQASLTGESLPVEKRPGPCPADAPLAARGNAIHLGTSVRSGTALALVTATGADTALSTIAARLGAPRDAGGFERGVRDFGALLLRVMLVMVVFVLVVNQWFDRPAVESLLFAVALAVGLSPELLPAIVTVTLARGARDMAAQGVLVRRLEAIENLGSMDVLCTDKTGTLTQGEMTLVSAVDGDGRDCRRVRELAYLNAALETGIANPLDAAIVAAGRAEKLPLSGWRKVDEIPYDFQRRRLTIVAASAQGPLMVTKGAFDQVLSICDRDADDRPLDARRREALGERMRAAAASGLRVLAVASREVEARAAFDAGDETGLRFEGLVCFADPPRHDAGKTLEALARLGIQVKLITGDNRHVAEHLARAVGLDARAVVTGDAMARMSDEALSRQARDSALFAEIDPQQKERIVRALQRGGHAVGYLGDGINDAPALHAADVGISVEGAVDVARETADVVLLRPDLGAIVRGVTDGRRSFANTLKYIRITTSANFGNMISMAAGTLLLPFLPMAAKQILLNNLMSDLPSIVIGGDRVDAAELASPCRWDIPELHRFMVVFGLLSSLFDLLAFALLLRVFDAAQATFQTGWFVFSLLSEIAILMALRTRGAAWRSPPAPWLIGLGAVTALAALSLPLWPQLAQPMGFTPLSASLLGALLALILAYVGCTELAKRYVAMRPARRRSKR
ncbi:magnesium-translocating P-type ATPase [Caldimonas sp. KR1-144]|uniref:magnesium-translocating P-type ATPase n=1 Tax=Caldimonas sp. KR1-144 TaxID=3400911 RepID=UPI003C0DF0A9